MEMANLNKSLKRIIISKKKILEIEQVILKKKKNGRSEKIYSRIETEYREVQKCISSIQKLNLIEGGICTENQYIIIRLLKENRFNKLTMKQIYDELHQGLQREIGVAAAPYKFMQQAM